MFGLIKSYDMLDNMFNATIYDAKHVENEWFANSFVSNVDGGYEVTIELPGLSRSDIDVNTIGHNLVVTATREFKSLTATSTRQYKRTWALPDKTNFESINAKYEAGLLKIHVPVKKESKRKIEVE